MRRLTCDAKVIGVSKHFLGKATPLLGNLSNLVLAICREYLTSTKRTVIDIQTQLSVIKYVMIFIFNMPIIIIIIIII